MNYETDRESVQKAFAIIFEKLQQNGMFDIRSVEAISILSSTAQLSSSDFEEIDNIRNGNSHRFLIRVLLSNSDQKIEAIKFFRSLVNELEHFNPSLKDSKDFVESLCEYVVTGEFYKRLTRDCHKYGLTVIGTEKVQSCTPLGKFEVKLF